MYYKNVICKCSYTMQEAVWRLLAQKPPESFSTIQIDGLQNIVRRIARKVTDGRG